MLDYFEMVIYAGVFPFCFFFAYRNLWKIDFRANVAIWSVPTLVGDYFLWQRPIATSALVFGMAATWALFVAFVYLAAFVDRWLRRRRGIGEPD